MRVLRSACLAASCLLSLRPAACPAAAAAGGALALTQDDVYRGISQTCGHPAAQADLHVRERGAPDGTAFAGVWGSVGLGGGSCGRAKEVDAYLGYSLSLTSILSATLTYTRHAFPGGSYGYGYGGPHLTGSRGDYDQLEMSWNVARRWYLDLAWTPDALRFERYGSSLRREQDRSAFAYGVEWRQPLASRLSLTAAAGYDRIADPSGAGYGFWSLGLTHVAGSLEVDVTYFRTAGRAVRLFGRQSAGGRVAATLLWHF